MAVPQSRAAIRSRREKKNSLPCFSGSISEAAKDVRHSETKYMIPEINNAMQSEGIELNSDAEKEKIGKAMLIRPAKKVIPAIVSASLGLSLAAKGSIIEAAAGIRIKESIAFSILVASP